MLKRHYNHCFEITARTSHHGSPQRRPTTLQTFKPERPRRLQKHRGYLEAKGRDRRHRKRKERGEADLLRHAVRHRRQRFVIRDIVSSAKC